MSSVSRENMDGLAQHGANVTADIKHNLQEVGRQALESAKKVANDIADSSMDTFHRYSEEGKKQLVKAEGYVQRNPIQTVLICAAAGVILSRFIKSFR